MKRSFFPSEGRWWKGNIHAHTTRSDGMCPPEQQIADYCARGYDFLAITDHNVVDSYQLAGQLPICMIPGWERDVRHCEDNTACIHVIGLLYTSAEETSFQERRRYDCREIPDQQLLDELWDAGQFVVLAHPWWSRMTPEEVLALNHFHAIEVFNTGCEQLMHAGRSDLYWDLLLQQGRKVWGIACDDTHGKTAKGDRFGGWLMVRAGACQVRELLQAMERGQFYLTQGPTIRDWGLEENTLYFQCTPCQEIHVVTYPARGTSLYAEPGRDLTEIAYSLKGGERYVRVECIDKDGRSAWTNPHFFENP